jgi:hypothetical protein
MRVFLAIIVAVVCGASIGTGTAVLKFRHHPWQGGVGSPPLPSGGHVTVDQEEFDFGKLDVTEEGKHEFTITNGGDKTLTLNPGASSCSCTLSEIKESELHPGQSTKVLVSWRSKRHVGPFKQRVTIVSSDPLRQEITFTIKGQYTTALYAEPDELTFGQIPGNAPVTQEARILCSLPGQQINIKGHQLSDPTLEKFFQIDYLPLEKDELRNYKNATSGILVRITVKPGLPLGSFQQRILLTTNLKTAPEIDLPLFGSVGEVSLVGPGWSSGTGILDIGEVDGRKTTQRKLIVLARGSDAKNMKFKVASVEPDFLNVKLGTTTTSDSAELSQTELLIEIPAGKALATKLPVNYMGVDNGKLGEIVLETVHPPIHSLRIRVRFAVASGN